MGIISVEQTNRLFWLGRYSERVYTTLRIYSNSFDSMIDEIVDSYQEFCRMIDIPDIYGSKEAFKERYPFDEENPDSILSNLTRAYDNAIVLREEIGSETLSYIQLAIYEMNKAKISRAPLIEMQRVIDNILAFWGMADDSIDSEKVRNIIKTGKRIERIDLYARLGMGLVELTREINRMAYRIERCGMKYDVQKIEHLKELVNAPKIDYYKIVHEVESIF
ncbi:MAG: alpha-E domain-containing protein [Lachnospiraceae bacterium]|nr:alpha-E domain-containing protein [Lachnospiraceae bacterium]